MSPSKSSSTALAFRCSVPTWTAMSCEPCMIVSPLASCSAQLKSRLKITNEWQVRRICSAILSTTVTNEFLSTSNVTGSSVRSMSAHLQADVQPLVDLRAHTRRHQRRGVELIDHGRALEAHAGGEVLARVGRGLERRCVEPDLPGLARLGQRCVRIGLVLGQADVLGGAGRHQLEAVELHRRVVAAVGELALVLGVE